MTTETVINTTPKEIKEPENCDFDQDMCGWESSNNAWFRTDGKKSDIYGSYGPGSDQTSIQSNIFLNRTLKSI